MATSVDSHGDFMGRSKPVLAVTIVMVTLCSVFVFFRILSRAAIVKKISVDDYFIIVAWALAVGYSISICYGAAYGLGRHESEVPAAWRPGLLRAMYASTIFYQPALMATKTSILAFYLTFSTANRTFRWACFATLFVVNAGGVALTMVTIFQCNPVSAVFQLVPPANARCTDILTIYLTSIPLNIITDLTLLFLPMPILTGMRLPRKQKIILIVTFSFGIFVAVVDVVRISYLQSASQMRLAETLSARATAESGLNSENIDSPFYLAFSFLWSAIEVTTGIMCACVPGLKPLVARFLPAMLRDPGDPPSHFGSFSRPSSAPRKAGLPVPDEVHHGDLGRAPQDEDREPMGMMEFLSGRRDFAQAPRERESEEGQGGALEFITTPNMNELGPHLPLERSATALTNTTRHTQPEPPAFFDFVDMSQRKSLVQMTNRESLYPVSVVTVLFFIWGFEYGLLDSLNHQFQTVAGLSALQAVGLRCAYYVGYFFGPLLVGRLVLKHWGFQLCFPVGLSIYAGGCLIFWPAAVLASWPTFLVTNFIVGFGLSILEVSANPFIALCGPARYAEIRLNLSQGVQAVGSVVAPLIADKAFYHTAENAPSLVSTQWAYLGIALATVALALVYYYVPLPEATDAELEDAAERLDGANNARVGGVRLIWLVLGLGLFSQFCYVGGQEVNGTLFNSYLGAIAPRYNQDNYFAIAHTAFAVSRFLAAGLGFWIKPRLMLLFFYGGAILFNALCTHFTGSAGVALMVLVFFCEGPQFSLIFAQCLRGQGKHTKFASVLMTAAIGGGSVFVPIATVVATSGRGYPYSLWVAVAAFAGGTLFALELNLSRRSRLLVDPIKDHTHPRVDPSSCPSSAGGAASRTANLFALGEKKRMGLGSVELREGKESPIHHT